MSDYIKRDKALAELHLNHKDVIYIDKQAAAERIRNIPYIDIVRCGECKWAETDRSGDKIFCTAIIPNFYIGENDFCSRGERKESRR